MKKVFSSASECIHVFAQRTQSEGRSGKVFFNGDNIYSYGYHYLLAKFVTNENSELAIIINDEGYSSTTSKHISWVFQATRQYKQFRTTQTEAKLVSNKMKSIYEKFSRAKKPQMYVDEANSLMYHYEEYIKWTGISNDINSDNIIREMYANISGGDLTELKAKADAIRKEQDRKILEKNKENIQKFLNHEAHRLNTPEDYVRISLDAKEIETSQGVKVPIREAKILYSMIKSGKDIHGFKIGYYTVIGLNGVLKIGCHKINKANMKEIGEKIINM